MTRESAKLKWERVDDSFNLILLDPKATNTYVLRERLRVIENTESWGRHFNAEASVEFDRWLQNLSTPLKAHAYARLSNWFLCDMKFIPETDLGKASERFWDTLFCAKPKRRLTDPKKDHKILPQEFTLWWPKQQKCQKDC